MWLFFSLHPRHARAIPITIVTVVNTTINTTSP